MAKKITLSVIKADVGSIGGHTTPSARMLAQVRSMLDSHGGGRLLIDSMVTHTGDDIALIMSHEHGEGCEDVHQLSWGCFKAATEIAEEEGLYGAGQDLLIDAPSGNVRGAGPAVAEIEFERDSKSKHRPAEAFMVFAADKCGPGAYNLPFYSVLCDPMHNTGLLLKPEMNKGWKLTIIDMDGKDEDRIITLDAPERIWDIMTLLRDIDRYAIEQVHSRHMPQEKLLSVSATRLHNIAGKYTGKDDPIAIFRTQGIFPAPEEIVHPWMIGHAVTGDCRGSHVMPIMPVPINTPVCGPYCLPIVSALALSMDATGRFSHAVTDVFAGIEWNHTRMKIQAKAEERRREGPFGYNMASQAELAYTGLVDAIARLDLEFALRAKRAAHKAGSPPPPDNDED